MSDQLRTKTVKALSHLGLGSTVGKVISLGTTLLLARLLNQQDYGLMGLAMVVISFIGVFSEVGVGAAIVQRKELEAGAVNGAFIITTMIGAGLALLTIAASPMIAASYNEPRLTPMLMILSIGFLTGGFGSVPMACLRRELQFKIISVLSIFAILLQCATTLVLALLGAKAWALVWGTVVANVINAAGAYWLSSWRPGGHYRIREAYDLVAYGFQVVISRTFWYIYTNADKAIIGWAINIGAVGIYNMAFSLATLPNAQITTLVVNVASPVLARLQGDWNRMNQVVLGLSRGIAYVTYPALIGMLITAKELIEVALGPNWGEATVPFRALCLMGLIKSVDPLLSQVLISVGKARQLSVYTAMCGVTMSVAIVLGARWSGLFGVSVVWALVYPILSLKLMHDVRVATGLTIWQYCRALAPVLLGACVMGAAVYLVRFVILAWWAPIALVTLLAQVATGVVVYLGWVVYVDTKGLREMRQVMLDLGVPAQRLERWPFNRVAA